MPGLTIYLLREEFEHPGAAVEGAVAEYQIGEDGTHLGTLYVQEMPEHPPKWAELFSGLMDTSIFNRVRSTSALYITRSGGRFFALAFGHGRHLMRAGAYEERFGLLVVINTLKANQLRSIDKRTFDTVDQNVRAQVSQGSPATEFGIDIERDLIRGITGQPIDSELGVTMTGADSLHVSVEVSIQSLDYLLQKYLEAYRSDGYKADFGWIDQIRQIGDSTELKARLDRILVERMSEAKDNGGHGDGLWLAIPEVVDYTGIHRFRFTGSRVSHNDLHLPGFVGSLGEDDEITVDLLKSKQAFAVDEDGYGVGDKWPVYRCIHLEVEEGDQTFLLAAGKWFGIRRSFTEEVNEFYRAVPMHDLQWMPYEHPSEGDYNTAISDENPARYALMDAVDVKVGGVRDKIEFCDLFSSDRELVHVKRYGASGLLGHLFNQGLVSGEHLRSDAGFQETVNGLLPESHQLVIEDRIPREVDSFSVIFAIISEHDGDDLHIPFFAKVAFKNVCTRLRDIGYRNIYRSKISVDQAFSRAERAKRKRKREEKSAAKKVPLKKVAKKVAAKKAGAKSGGALVTPARVDASNLGRRTLFKASKG